MSFVLSGPQLLYMWTERAHAAWNTNSERLAVLFNFVVGSPPLHVKSKRNIQEAKSFCETSINGISHP